MYEQFYKLTGLPFQLTPDPRLLFHARDHSRAESYLLYGLQRCEGLVVITGHVGTGKTLLLQNMLDGLRDRHLAIARVALANLDAVSVMPSVAAAFGIDPTGLNKFELMEALTEHLMPSRRRGSLLIVDEAQAASMEALEELRTLSNLQAYGRSLIQIFLIGQSELHETLARPDMAHLRQRIVASHHLRPLDSSEIQGYIDFRLEQFGRNGPPYLSQGIFERVYEWSGGIPRRINLLMDRLLLYGYLEDKTELDVDDLEVVITEFAEEFADDLLVEGGEESQASVTPASSGIEAETAELSNRMQLLEQAMRAEFGHARVDASLESHKSWAERRALADVRSRLTRLENLLCELTRNRDHDISRMVESPAESPPAPSQAASQIDNAAAMEVYNTPPASDENRNSDQQAAEEPGHSTSTEAKVNGEFDLARFVPVDAQTDHPPDVENPLADTEVFDSQSPAGESERSVISSAQAARPSRPDSESNDFARSRLSLLFRWPGNGR